MPERYAAQNWAPLGAHCKVYFRHDRLFVIIRTDPVEISNILRVIAKYFRGLVLKIWNVGLDYFPIQQGSTRHPLNQAFPFIIPTTIQSQSTTGHVSLS